MKQLAEIIVVGPPDVWRVVVRTVRRDCRVLAFSTLEELDHWRHTVSSDDPSIYPDLVAALAEACPALVGSALDVEGQRVGEGYILNRNGRDFIKDRTALTQPGDRLLLMSSSAGG